MKKRKATHHCGRPSENVVNMVIHSTPGKRAISIRLQDTKQLHTVRNLRLTTQQLSINLHYLMTKQTESCILVHKDCHLLHPMTC
ncbi:hypothetical protein Y032_0172g337 [Ancylostoma ceylanicum]|uniref:Uncharacterized protein n=1 Tax=Ancylostoma ceylanicum TaxID=53326 RepID=A0A016SUZ3_9BILA|nr:hypothetical protein Y032_0172g337 [Ancylostoma ceylanicum]